MFEQSNHLYDNYNKRVGQSLPVQGFYKNHLFIPFNRNWKSIGINLSGGADSACLTTILCDYIVQQNLETEVHIITYIRCWNTRPWQQLIALNVFETIQKMYPKISFFRHPCYIPPELESGSGKPKIGNKSGDQIIVTSYNHYISYQKKLSAVYNATTLNPRGTCFHDRDTSRDKKVEEAQIHDVIYSAEQTVHVRPFRFVEKDWVLAQFKLDSRLDLLEKTRSCEADLALSPELFEADFKSLDAYNNQLIVAECGTCFWCNEKRWALNNIDEVIEKIKNS